MEINELEEKIKYYAEKYYNGEEIIDDKEYDKLILELRDKDPTNKLLDTVIDDTDNIPGFTKEKLPETMGTLKKAQNEEEVKKLYNNEIKKYIVEDKIDGAGVLLVYINGVLSKALSRGNSDYGFDITQNFIKIPFKSDIKKPVYLLDGAPFTGCIRGEVVMFSTTFDKYFSKEMKNPRNATAGIMKRLDGTGCEKLNFIAYDVFYPTIKTEKEKLILLANNGFYIPKWKEVNSYDEIISIRKELSEKRNEIKYPIDGIVVKTYDVDYEDLKRKTPLKNFAVKFDLDYAISILRNIEWNMSGKELSPVAIFDPVELCGTTVQRATLHNINKMQELGVEIGKKIMIVKRGEIIPKVEKVL